MAKITFQEPIKTVSGKLSKKHYVVHCVRTAPTNNPEMIANPQFTQWRDPNKKVVLSNTQREWTTLFGQICQATHERMINPEYMDVDRAGFAKQNKYKSLYSYVWNQVKMEMA